MKRNQKKILALLSLACALILALCWAFRGQECQVVVERRPEADQSLPEGCTVQIEGNEILIRDYWRPMDSYTTVYASAQLWENQLTVRSRRAGAADEMTATGSDVLLRVKLPDGVKADRVKKVKVYSKGYGLGNVTQVSLPLQSDILPKQDQP